MKILSKVKQKSYQLVRNICMVFSCHAFPNGRLHQPWQRRQHVYRRIHLEREIAPMQGQKKTYILTYSFQFFKSNWKRTLFTYLLHSFWILKMKGGILFFIEFFPITQIISPSNFYSLSSNHVVRICNGNRTAWSPTLVWNHTSDNKIGQPRSERTIHLTRVTS